MKKKLWIPIIGLFYIPDRPIISNWTIVLAIYQALCLGSLAAFIALATHYYIHVVSKTTP